MDFVYGEIDMCPLDFIPFSLPISQLQISTANVSCHHHHHHHHHVMLGQ